MTIPPPEDFGGLFQGLERIQRQLAEAEAATAQEAVIGTAGGDAVRIHVSGDFIFTAVEIAPAALAGGDVGLLEDLVLAALHDAVSKLMTARNAAMGSVVTDAFGALFGGLGVDEDSDFDPTAFGGGELDEHDAGTGDLGDPPGELPPAKD